jgi:hypothetical protein
MMAAFFRPVQKQTHFPPLTRTVRASERFAILIPKTIHLHQLIAPAAWRLRICPTLNPIANPQNHHLTLKRALVSPPRLPALCSGFHASATNTKKPARTGGPQQKRSSNDHAISCTIVMHHVVSHRQKLFACVLMPSWHPACGNLFCLWLRLL